MSINPPKVEWFPGELEVMRPPEKITISEHAARTCVLGRHSAIKGLYRLDMVPFFVPIMDDCGDPDVDEIGCCKPAQIGGTLAMLVNIILYYCDQDASPIMAVLADQDTAEYVSTEKIAVVFEESEHLERLYDPKFFTKDEVKLPNGARIDISWASSVSRLGTKTCRITIGDEINKPGWSKVTNEAGAMSLLRERAETYPIGYRKHIWLSTPTTKSGNITLLMESFDIVFDWHVPCPHCKQHQPLRWSEEHCHEFEDGMYRGDDGAKHRLGRIEWEGGRDATPKQILGTARYCCGECGVLWTTVEKNAAVRNGKMVPRTEPTGYERKKFYHLNRILSLFPGGRLEVLVQKWVSIFKLSGKEYRDELKGFVNSTLAEPFEDVIVSFTETKILNARVDLPPQTVPHDVAALTAGIDVQKYGFWFIVRAWLKNFTSWLIHYGQLATWEDVEELLFEAQYPVQGTEYSMKIWRAAVDTGGGKKYKGMSMTEATYWWLRKNAVGRGCRCWGTKGSSTPLAGIIKIGKAFDKTPSGKPITGGLQIISLDTNKLKDMYHYRLQQAIEGGDQAAYLHADVAEDYAQHILAEEKRRRPNGMEFWEQIKPRNDLLDAETLAAVVANPEWPGGGVNLIRGRVNVVRPEEKEAPVKKKKKSGFVNAWKK